MVSWLETLAPEHSNQEEEVSFFDISSLRQLYPPGCAI